MNSKRIGMLGLFFVILTVVGGVLPAAYARLLSVRDDRSSRDQSQIYSPTSTGSGSTIGLAFLQGVVVASKLPSSPTSASSTIHSMPNRISSANAGPLGSVVPNSASLSPSTISVLAKFEGLNQTVSCGCTPPDVILAAGPNHVVEMVNLAGEIFTKSGSPLLTFPLSSFFLTGPDLLSDPKVLYDSSSGRWFASIFHFNVVRGYTVYTLAIAVSAGSDPTGIWQVYSIKTGLLAPDQPLLGVSDDKLIISTNMFADNDLVGSQYWILNKNEMLAAAGTVDLASVGPVTGLESAYPVQSLSPTTTQYLVSVGGGEIGTSSSIVRLISITGVPPGRIVVNTVTMSVSTINNPPAAIEPGGFINTNDFRVLSGVWFSGKIWYSLTDSCIPSGGTSTQSCARLTQLSTSTPRVLQDFDLGIKNTDVYYPAVSVDGKGDMVAVYGFSNSTVYPAIAVTGQVASDPSGSLAQSKTLRSGVASENSGLFRYGDYFGAATDPSDTRTIWVGGEYIPGSCPGSSINCWGTFLGSTTMIKGFRLSASQSYLNVQPGSTVQSAIAARSVGGFVGTIALSSSTSPAGPTVSLSPNSITLAVEGTGTSTLTVTTSQNTPSGLYSITVNGANGTIAASITLSLVVGPDFTLMISPGTLTAQAGSLAASTIALKSLNGLAGTVSLSAIVSQSGPTASVSPVNVTLVSGGSGSSSLSLTSSIPGFYTIEIDGSFGSILHTSTLTFYVNGFILGVSPSAVSIPAGSSTSSQVVATSLNGFTGTVNLATSVSPSGPSASLSSSSIILTAGSSANSTLTVSTTSSTPPGQYTVTATGVNASDSQVSTFTIVVTPFYFTLNDVENLTGIRVTTTVSLSYDSPSTTLTASGTGSVVAVNATTGSAMFSKTYTITKFPIGSRSQFFLWVGVSPYPLTARVSIGSPTVLLARSIDINADGLIDRDDLNAIGAGFGCSVGMTCYNPRLDLNADGVVNIIDLVYVSGNYGTIDYVPNFTLTSSPGTIVVSKGFSATATVTLTSTNGFAGTVTLSAVTSNTVTATLSATSITLSSGGTGTATLTISSSTLGAFPLSLTATNGSISNTLIVTVKVADFFVYPTLPLVCFTIGTPYYPTSIALRSLNGYAGTVSLALSVSPSTGLIATAKNSLILTADFGGNQTLVSLSSRTVGFYTVTVTATSGSLSHTTTFDVQVTRSNCSV